MASALDPFISRTDIAHFSTDMAVRPPEMLQ